MTRDYLFLGQAGNVVLCFVYHERTGLSFVFNAVSIFSKYIYHFYSMNWDISDSKVAYD